MGFGTGPHFLVAICVRFFAAFFFGFFAVFFFVLPVTLTGAALPWAALRLRASRSAFNLAGVHSGPVSLGVSVIALPQFQTPTPGIGRRKVSSMPQPGARWSWQIRIGTRNRVGKKRDFDPG